MMKCNDQLTQCAGRLCLAALLLITTGLGACAQKKLPHDRERKKMSEITSVIKISNLQETAIHDALSYKRNRQETMDSTVSAKQMAYQKYAIDKEYHEKFIKNLTDKQIAEYCNIVFAPEVDAKTDYRMSLLKDVDNDYTEEELTAARKKIYDYLMLEKIVYFKYKYDFAKQKENIGRLKELQPTSLKSSLNNEKQKLYDKVKSGRVSWHNKK